MKSNILLFSPFAFRAYWLRVISLYPSYSQIDTRSDFHISFILEISFVKGTNGHQKTYEIFHVYCFFYSGFMCQTTVIFGITKDGSLVLNTLAS